MSPVNRAEISAHGVSVWLRVELDLLWNRVRHKSTRPLLRTANPRDTLRTLLEVRNPVYALADIAVQAQPEYSVDDLARKVLEALAEYGGIVETE